MCVHSVSVMSDSLPPPQTVAHICPWNSPGRNTGVGCHFLLQGIFATQGSSPGFLHCRQILYRRSHQGLRKVNVHSFIAEPSVVSHWLPCHAPYVGDSLGFHFYWPYLNELPCKQYSNSWSVTVFYTQDTWAQSPRTGAHPQTSATEGGRRPGEQLGPTQVSCCYFFPSRVLLLVLSWC